MGPSSVIWAGVAYNDDRKPLAQIRNATGELPGVERDALRRRDRSQRRALAPINAVVADEPSATEPTDLLELLTALEEAS